MTAILEVDFVPLCGIYRAIIDLAEENLNQKSVFLWGLRVVPGYRALGAVPYTGYQCFH